MVMDKAKDTLETAKDTIKVKSISLRISFIHLICKLLFWSKTKMHVFQGAEQSLEKTLSSAKNMITSEKKVNHCLKIF